MSKGTSMTSFGLSRPVPVLRGLIDEDCWSCYCTGGVEKMYFSEYTIINVTVMLLYSVCDLLLQTLRALLK